MKIAVIVNENGGSSTGADNDITVDTIRSAFSQCGVSCTILAVPGSDIKKTAQQAVHDGFEKIIAGGGDGTISTVASALSGTSIPMGVLPLGTLNHFAKDLGIPATLDEAVHTAVHGVQKEIDVAEVNGHIFINNSSLGLYPHLVKGRDGLIERLGIGKWSAMALAFWRILGKFPLYTLTVEAHGKATTAITPLVFVGNNQYDMSLLELGNRTRIDAGELCVYMAQCSGRFGLLVFALRAVFGTLNQSKNFESSVVRQIRIDTRRRSLRVALDGEVMTLSSPLLYRVRPRDLVVMVPHPEE